MLPWYLPLLFSKAELINSSGVCTSPSEDPPWLPVSDIPWSPQTTNKLGREASSCKSQKKDLSCHTNTIHLDHFTIFFTFKHEYISKYISSFLKLTHPGADNKRWQQLGVTQQQYFLEVKAHSYLTHLSVSQKKKKCTKKAFLKKPSEFTVTRNSLED